MVNGKFLSKLEAVHCHLSTGTSFGFQSLKPKTAEEEQKLSALQQQAQQWQQQKQWQEYHSMMGYPQMPPMQWPQQGNHGNWCHLLTSDRTGGACKLC